MKTDDAKEFRELLGGVFAFYDKDVTPFAADVWWNAMLPFDFAAVKDAFNRHCVNPDRGQWLPKPADIVKAIAGGTQDAALIAWTKVDKAVRMVGPYQSVCFDEGVINRVIADMGGWVELCSRDDEAWPFVAKEFETRYRGYRTRSDVHEWPQLLHGIAESSNAAHGYELPSPVLIGDAATAAKVLAHGDKSSAPAFTRLADFATATTRPLLTKQ